MSTAKRREKERGRYREREKETKRDKDRDKDRERELSRSSNLYSTRSIISMKSPTLPYRITHTSAPDRPRKGITWTSLSTPCPLVSHIIH